MRKGRKVFVISNKLWEGVSTTTKKFTLRGKRDYTTIEKESAKGVSSESGIGAVKRPETKLEKPGGLVVEMIGRESDRKSRNRKGFRRSTLDLGLNYFGEDKNTPDGGLYTL